MKTKSKNKCMCTPERYVNAKAVSMYTSLAEGTVYEWAKQGKMPSIQAGRRVLFDLQDIDRFMDSLKRPCNQVEMVANNILGGINGNCL